MALKLFVVWGLQPGSASQSMVPPRVIIKGRDLSGRWLLFSGGKMEMRKGQDLVVRAFARFLKRHPDAMLVTMWWNPWQNLVETIDDRGLVHGFPHFINRSKPDPQHTNLSKWLQDNGIPPSSHMDLGRITSIDLAAVLQQVDCAIFTNRAEGGTNLVAMEALGSGLPTIITVGTGHSDLLRSGRSCYADHTAPNDLEELCRINSKQATSTNNNDTKSGFFCYPLAFQQMIAQDSWKPYISGWTEPRVEDIVLALEQVRSNPEEAKVRGQVAAVLVNQSFSWAQSISSLVEILDNKQLL